MVLILVLNHFIKHYYIINYYFKYFYPIRRIINILDIKKNKNKFFKFNSYMIDICYFNSLKNVGAS